MGPFCNHILLKKKKRFGLHKLLKKKLNYYFNFFSNNSYQNVLIANKIILQIIPQNLFTRFTMKHFDRLYFWGLA